MSEKENTLATKYDPKEVEDKWYQYWESHDLFKSVPDEREPYCIVKFSVLPKWQSDRSPDGALSAVRPLSPP